MILLMLRRAWTACYGEIRSDGIKVPFWDARAAAFKKFKVYGITYKMSED